MARLEQHSLGTRIRTNDYDYVAERRQVAILVPDQGLARSSTEMCTHKKPKDGCAREALLPYPLDLITKRDSNVVEEHHWVHRSVRRLPRAIMLSWRKRDALQEARENIFAAWLQAQRVMSILNWMMHGSGRGMGRTLRDRGEDRPPRMTELRIFKD